jgi:hypothetical protein
MITIETKLGDVVTNHYGETGTVIGETSGGLWWIILKDKYGSYGVARKVAADTVVIIGIPIEGGN